jgi:hypothetical protein
MSEPDDQLLTSYLLGQLAEEETESLDGRSIADDSFALRLEAAENDLLDAFLNGELSGDLLEQFKRVYFSSPARLRKIEFARALLQVSQKARFAEEPAATGTRERASASRSIWAWLTSAPARLQWTFAAAALVLLFAAGFLVRQNRVLREQARAARQQQSELNLRTQQLEHELNEQRAKDGTLAQVPENSTQSTANPALTTLAVLLLPQTRGEGQVTRVSIPPRADHVNLQLQLESDDFPAYRVALNDPASGQVLWTSAKLKSARAANTRVVLIHPPGGLLKPQTYVLELSGVAPGRSSEFISSYVFKTVIE